MSDDDLRCPDCHHPLGMHPYYYGTCEAPIGGMFNHDKCGCILTLHDLIKNLQAQDVTKKLAELQARHDICINEIVVARDFMMLSRERLEFLQAKLNKIKDLLTEATLIEETRPFYGWFTIDYRNQMHEIIEKALLELENEDEEFVKRLEKEVEKDHE